MPNRIQHIIPKQSHDNYNNKYLLYEFNLPMSSEQFLTLFSQGELSQNYCKTNFAASNLLQTSTLISEIVKVYYSPHFRSLYTSLGKATELFLQS